MGLDAASIGASAIERAVQQRQAACGLETDALLGARLRLLRRTSGSDRGCGDPETWFFRDREAFVALARVAGEEWLRAHPDTVLRLLSLPCSTGEEPYSMAMTLLDVGVPANRFRIDAIDISGHALARARHASYGKKFIPRPRPFFSGSPFSRPAPGKWELSPSVRQQIHFQSGNMLDHAFLPAAKSTTSFFCRNVLIYFDRATRSRRCRAAPAADPARIPVRRTFGNQPAADTISNRRGSRSPSPFGAPAFIRAPPNRSARPPPKRTAVLHLRPFQFSCPR